jgi:hypothetical protein
MKDFIRINFVIFLKYIPLFQIYQNDLKFKLNKKFIY